MVVGGQGTVLSGSRNNIRSRADGSSTQLGQIWPGEVFTVTGNAVCAGGLQWWPINFNDISGWTAAGDAANQWIEAVGNSSTSGSGGGNNNPPPNNGGGNNNPPTNVQTGPMYIDTYCQSLGYTSSNSVRSNANSWYCQDGSRQMSITDMSAICRYQYAGAMPIAEASNPNDSYSWYCRSGNTNSNPVPTPTSVPQYQYILIRTCEISIRNLLLYSVAMDPTTGLNPNPPTQGLGQIGLLINFAQLLTQGATFPDRGEYRVYERTDGTFGYIEAVFYRNGVEIDRGRTDSTQLAIDPTCEYFRLAQEQFEQSLPLS